MEKNLESSAIDVLARNIQEHLGSQEIMDLYEDGLNEVYTQDEIVNDNPEVFGRMMHAAFARALLRAAEDELIQAAGMVDDNTSSSVPVG